MTDINSVVIAGRLVKNAEYRTVGQTTQAKFSLAVRKSHKTENGWEDEVSYIDVQAWGRMAENTEGRLTQGTKCTVKGTLKQERWEQDGHRREKVYIVAELIDAPKEQANGF